jgi:DNA-binding SARP family transcriptional activator
VKLAIELFGSVRVEQAGQELALRPASQMLLLYLLLHRTRYQRREALAALFWGDSSDKQARRSLNSALWRLRRELEPDAPEVLTSNQQGDIRFALRDGDRLDVAEFEIIIRSSLDQPPEALDPPALASLEHAVVLYQGDLAENCYDDWVLPERERLRALYLDALTLLLKSHIHQQAYTTAIITAHRLLLADSLREDVHRDLMRLYSATHQRERALQQYLICRQLLDDELQVAPLPETTALYDDLQANRALDGPSATGLNPPARQVRRNGGPRGC